MNNRGEAITGVILALALLGGLAFFAFRPKSSHGESRRAEQSQQTTEALIDAQEKRGSVAAAYNVKSSEVIGTLPNGPEKTFLEQSSQIIGTNLPPPDQNALIQAERLKNAILQGRLEESTKLYEEAIGDSRKLQRDLTVALAKKRESDDRLQEVAALHRGAEMQRNQIIIVAVVIAGLYFYTKITHLSPRALGEAVADIKTGRVNPIVALDSVATRLQQKLVKKVVQSKS